MKPGKVYPQAKANSHRAEALLDATETLLIEGGASALSARAITTQAGLNKALLFYYWGSVDAVVDAALDRFFERHFTALEAAAKDQEESSARERVRTIVGQYLAFIEGRRVYVQISQEQIARRGRHFPTVQRHLHRLLGWTENLLDGIVPKEGPLSAKHFHLSLSAVVVNYFSYGLAIGEERWGQDPLSKAALFERREHILWIVDTWLDALGVA